MSHFYGARRTKENVLELVDCDWFIQTLLLRPRERRFHKLPVFKFDLKPFDVCPQQKKRTHFCLARSAVNSSGGRREVSKRKNLRSFVVQSNQ